MSKGLMMPDKTLIKPAYMPEADSFGGSQIPHEIKSLEEIDPERVRCLGCRVLLKVMSVDSLTKGGLYKTTKTIMEELFAKCIAVLVKKGSQAFLDFSDAEEIPMDGETVIIAKYSGITMRDKDFNLYRFANDTDVVSIYEGESK